MKKKLLVVMLLLVTLAVLAIPTPALAWGGWSNQTAFVARAMVGVTDAGTVQVKPLGTSYLLLNTTGEQVAGTIESSRGWPAIDGYNIVFSHQSRTIINLNTMRITGTATGTVTVLTPAGAPVMTGTYSSFIYGTVSVDPVTMGITYDKIYDSATFSINGIPGTDFAGISANGFGFANLDWIGYTLYGPMTLTGTYK